MEMSCDPSRDRLQCPMATGDEPGPHVADLFLVFVQVVDAVPPIVLSFLCCAYLHVGEFKERSSQPTTSTGKNMQPPAIQSSTRGDPWPQVCRNIIKRVKPLASPSGGDVVLGHG